MLTLSRHLVFVPERPRFSAHLQYAKSCVFPAAARIGHIPITPSLRSAH